MLFETTVKGSALSSEDASGLLKFKADAEKKAKAK